MSEVRISVRRLTFVSLLTPRPFQVKAQVCSCDLKYGIAVLNQLFWSIDAAGLFLAGILLDYRVLLGHDSNATPSNCVKKGCAAICPEGLFITFRFLAVLGTVIDRDHARLTHDGQGQSVI
jgi:hypothetical protein